MPIHVANLDGSHADSTCWCRNKLPAVLTHKEACLLSLRFNGNHPHITDGEEFRINQFLKELIGDSPGVKG